MTAGRAKRRGRISKQRALVPLRPKGRFAARDAVADALRD